MALLYHGQLQGVHQCVRVHASRASAILLMHLQVAILLDIRFIRTGALRSPQRGCWQHTDIHTDTHACMHACIHMHTCTILATYIAS